MALSSVLKTLRVEIEAAGSMRAWARWHEVSAQYVCDVLKERREPGQKILDALGLEKIVTYKVRYEPKRRERKCP